MRFVKGAVGRMNTNGALPRVKYGGRKQWRPRWKTTKRRSRQVIVYRMNPDGSKGEILRKEQGRLRDS